MAARADDIFSASLKVSLTKSSFLAYLLPYALCLYLMGVLVQLKGTRFYRLALLPFLLWFFWRSTFIDWSGGDLTKIHRYSSFVTQSALMTMWGTAWALAREPYRRQTPSTGGNESDSESIYTALWNGWALLSSARGIEWNWPRGLVLPKRAVATESRFIFVLSSAAWMSFHALCVDIIHQIIHMLSPTTFGSVAGGSLFDNTLPPFLEVSRSVLVSALTIWMMYLGLEWGYSLLAIICVVLFRQRPSQWPPIFNAPWLSTSLNQLWGRRWHQILRHAVVTLGLDPFEYLFGRLGGVLGAFLISGIIHEIEFRAIGRGGNTVVIVGFWLMNGVGVVLERIWKRMTGNRVEGFCGWLWTFGWLALFGVPVVEEWAKAGRFGVESLPGYPSLAVMGFVRSLVGL